MKKLKNKEIEPILKEKKYFKHPILASLVFLSTLSFVGSIVAGVTGFLKEEMAFAQALLSVVGMAFTFGFNLTIDETDKAEEYECSKELAFAVKLKEDERNINCLENDFKRLDIQPNFLQGKKYLDNNQNLEN